MNDSKIIQRIADGADAAAVWWSKQSRLFRKFLIGAGILLAFSLVALLVS